MLRPIKHNGTAVLALFIACSLWGTAFLFGKIALSELTVSQVVLYRFAIASFALIPIVLLRRDRLQAQDIPLFILTGFLTVPVTFMLQFGGLALTNASRASLIMGGIPPLLALGSVLFQHERISKRGWGAVSAATLGVFLIVGNPGSGDSWLGDGLVVLSLITSVAWVLLSRRLIQKYSGLTATAFILTFGMLTLLPISLVQDGMPRVSLSTGVWGSVLALGLICTASTFTMWNWALAKVSPARAGVFVNLEPVVGTMLGVMVFHDTLGLITVVGGALVLIATWIISRPESEPSRLEREAEKGGWVF